MPVKTAFEIVTNRKFFIDVFIIVND